MGDHPDQAFSQRSTLNSQPSTALVNCQHVSPETNGELSTGKLGSMIGVDMSNLWFVFRCPFLYARLSAQAAKPLAPGPRQFEDAFRCDSGLTPVGSLIGSSPLG